MFKRLDDAIGERLGRGLARIENKLGSLGGFVGLIDAGEILDLAGQSSLVQTFGVAGDRRFERRINEDLQKLPRRRSVANQLSLRAERQLVRDTAAPGEFLEIFVDTPLETAIARDPKGLYKRALAGEIKNFTGVGQAYEAPEAADIVLKSAIDSADALADRVVGELEARGIIARL